MTKKAKAHYVDNAQFLEAIREWRGQCMEADEIGKPRPPITNYIGECFLKIATHLSYRPNFINYTYRDEMISDGIENCLQYVYNFDPEKSKNPFAYFTQIIYYAFIRRIQKEKKQQHVKHKYIENMNVEFITEQAGADGEVSGAYVEYLQQNFLPAEDVYKPKKKKPKPKGLENFYDEDETKSEDVDENSTDN
jgi:DNA-directed RNA polymerase specialized sigma24 family protein